MKKHIKFVCVTPDGKICGPIGDDEAFVKEALCKGLERVCGQVISTARWSDVESIGYSVRKAEIVLLPTD